MQENQQDIFDIFGHVFPVHRYKLAQKRRNTDQMAGAEFQTFTQDKQLYENKSAKIFGCKIWPLSGSLISRVKCEA